MNDAMPAALAINDQGEAQSLQTRLRELRTRLQSDNGRDEVKLRKACQDFEAVFIGQIWKQMRASVPKDGMLQSKEQESYLSMFDQEMAVKMAGAGGIGLSDMLYANLSDRLVNASKEASSSNPLLPLNRPAAAASTEVAPVAPRTLATLTAQHEAEMLARSIEKKFGAAGLSAPTTPDLEDALRVVSLDQNGEL